MGTGLTVGFWKDKDEIKKSCELEKKFSPSMTDKIRKNKYEGWKKDVLHSKNWEEN